MDLLFNDFLLNRCQKKQESLNRQDAKDTKFKTQSRDIVQNRVSVLDKAAFSFAACPVKREACLTGVTRQMKKHPVFLGDLRVLSDHAKAWERAVNSFFGLRECPALVPLMPMIVHSPSVGIPGYSLWSFYPGCAGQGHNHGPSGPFF